MPLSKCKKILLSIRVTRHSLERKHTLTKQNPLHPIISLQILHIILYTFPIVLAEGIWLIINPSWPHNHFHNSCDLHVVRNYMLITFKGIKDNCIILTLLQQLQNLKYSIHYEDMLQGGKEIHKLLSLAQLPLWKLPKTHTLQLPVNKY